MNLHVETVIKLLSLKIVVKDENMADTMKISISYLVFEINGSIDAAAVSRVIVIDDDSLIGFHKSL